LPYTKIFFIPYRGFKGRYILPVAKILILKYISKQKIGQANIGKQKERFPKEGINGDHQR